MAADAVVLERFVHPQLGFAIDVPLGAAVDVNVPPGIALVVREALEATRSPFRANITVVVERLEPGTGLDAYVEGSMEVQERMLDGFHLLDRAPAEIGGRPAVRTLGHVVRDGLPVVIEQWRLVDEDLGWAIAASCDVFDFPLVGETFAACAESLLLPDAAR